METIYPFKWLDNLVMNKLSSEGISVSPLSSKDIILVGRALTANREILPFEFLQKLLSLKNERQCKRLVNRYHLQLVLLQDCIRENLQYTKKIHPEIYQLNKSANEFVEYLLSLIETRFPNYLRRDSAVSDTFRNIKIAALKKQLKKIRGTAPFSQDPVLTEILLPLAESIPDNKEVSYGQLNYWIEILNGLLSIDTFGPFSHFTSIEKFLINMNFNHDGFAAHLQKKILNSMDDGSNPLHTESWKRFQHIAIRKDVRYSDTHQSLERIMQVWFTVNVLKKPGSTAPLPSIKKETCVLQKSLPRKTTIRLSVDQLGILLRAADQTKLLDAPSFSHVCETMAPVLSTPDREEISPRSLRSNAYPSENSDKLVTIRSLEKMIQWIREC